MGRLAIRSVRYSGSRFEFQSPVLPDGVLIVEGTNGSGKTTLADLIYYGMGGEPKQFRATGNQRHKQIASDTENYVELVIEVGGETFWVRRFLGVSEVALRSSENSAPEVLQLRRTGTTVTFSDWLMERLGIEPITLWQGTRSWRLGFNDLARLVYHDQAPNPTSVFKGPDVDSPVTESRDLRRAIFEVLVGRSFHEYYARQGELYGLEAERQTAVSGLQLFRETIPLLGDSQPDSNLEHIDEQLDELRGQLSRLVTHREALLSRPEVDSGLEDALRELRAELSQAEGNAAAHRSRQRQLSVELADLQIVRRDLVLEATHLRKIMYTDEQLSLFSLDTCPYCLRPCVRGPNECICGSEIPDDEYRRFFYSASEYREMLKSKQKNLATVDLAIAAVQTQMAEVSEIVRKATEESEAGQARAREFAKVLNASVNMTELRRVDDQIVSIEKRLGSLEQQRAIEGKRQQLEEGAAQIEKRRERLRAEVGGLHARAVEDMEVSVDAFNERYQDMMKAALPDCRTARIDQDYRPIINSNEYFEASAGVPIRLMYYFTLLSISIELHYAPFPRFLLVDTPETAGIDAVNLKRAIGQLDRVLALPGEPMFQVLLTTGVGKYPAAYRDRVVLSLDEQHRLLQPRKV